MEKKLGKAAEISHINEIMNRYEFSYEILNSVNPEWDNLTKALYVYIEIEKRIGRVDSHTASQLYKAILDRLEIGNRIIHGSSDYSWNEIEIDGEYYPVDLSADIDYYNENIEKGQIGVCNFAVNQEFYNNPNHRTKEAEGAKSLIAPVIDEKRIAESLQRISHEYATQRITNRPEISIKSKELRGLFDGGVVTRETVNQRKDITLLVSDGDLEEVKSDLAQIATYYPELLNTVEIKAEGADNAAMQEMVNEVCKARNIAKTSPVAKPNFELIISGSRPEDFDLDFSAIEDVIIPGTPIDSNRDDNRLTLRNTTATPFLLPDIGSRLGGIEVLDIAGLDVSNLDISSSIVRRLELHTVNTINIDRIRGLERLREIELCEVGDAQVNNYLAGPYRRSPELFDITIRGVNFSGREILRELRRGNPNITRIDIDNCQIDNVRGIEEFGSDLTSLNIFANNLSIADIRQIMQYEAAHFRGVDRDLDLFAYHNFAAMNEINSIGGISADSMNLMASILEGYDTAFVPTIRDGANINLGKLITVAYGWPGLPYYLKDARIMREQFALTKNPIMIENVSELDTTNFNERYLQGATLLLTKAQLEHLINSGRSIPQNVRLLIENVSELTSDEVRNFSSRCRANGINLSQVSVMDRTHGNSQTESSPYSLSEYIYIRDTLDLVTSGIDPSEPDIDKFTTVYLRLANAIRYNIEASTAGRVDRDHSFYFSERLNKCRNMLDGLVDGTCVCAGYADILRNALALVGVDARMVSGPGHAWNQIKIDGRWYDTDLTWDRQVGYGVDPSSVGVFDWMLKGSRNFDPYHPLKSGHSENIETDDYPRMDLINARRRANSRMVDFTHSRDPIDIPEDPVRVIVLDRNRIRDEYQRRLDDMYAKFYGDRDFEREYHERSERYRSHEARKRIRGTNIIFRTVDNYPEREEDERFLLLDKYRESLERVTRYESGDTSVYSGTQAQIDQALERDREYIRTRNYTFNQHEHTQRDLATLGKYGERMPYIPRQRGILRNAGRILLNGGILLRNGMAPIYRGIGRFIAQPVHRLVTGGRDASPYRNNSYHRMVARRDYFLDEARRRDANETARRRATASDPSRVRPVSHPIRNILEARVKALFQVSRGNEAVLRAGAADIRQNIQDQEGESGWIAAARQQVATLRRQINALNQELIARPHASNIAEVQAAVQAKRQQMQNIEARIAQTTVEATQQTDAVSNSEHAIASKEVNTLRVTAIKGVMKGVAVRYVGPKIHDWLMARANKTRTVPTSELVREETQAWVPTTYKTQTTPIYEEVLDTGKSMRDIMGRNSGRQVTGFYSVWGGERRPATYSLTGNEKITAVFQQIGGGGKGFSDTAGLRAPVLVDGTFPQELLDGSGYLRQDISLDQLLQGLNLSGADTAALEGVYVSVGDRYWTSLANLVQGMTKNVQVGTTTRQVVDVAGHYEPVVNFVTKTGTKIEHYLDPASVARINVAENVGRGALTMDTIQDVFENVRNTSTNETDQKRKPRRYTHTDRDLGSVPTSRREYRRQQGRNNGGDER